MDTQKQGAKHPIDHLIDGARIRGESRMILDTTDPGTITREQGEAVINAVLAYLNDSGVKRREVAKDLNVAASTLGQVLNWKYGGQWQGIVADLDRWLEQRQKQDATPATAQFVWTKVAEEIRTVADVAVTLRKKGIGLVYGPESSGVGKTITLQALLREFTGSALVTVEKMVSGRSGLIKSIARALRIGDQQQTEKLYARVKAELQNTNRLLMIDQIHNLTNARDHDPFFVLCDIWDATQAPQLWCGTSDIVAYLNQRQKRGKESLAQIRRRIIIQRDLLERTRDSEDGPGEPLYTPDEIRKIFAKCPMRLAPDSVQYLAKVANEPDQGALGLVTSAVELAVQTYHRTQQVLTRDMLRAVFRSLMTPKGFRHFERQMDEALSRPLAKVG